MRYTCKYNKNLIYELGDIAFLKKSGLKLQNHVTT